MGNFNRFGATYDQVVELYPKTVAADYDPASAGTSGGGQAEIESVLDRIAREVAAALRPDVFTQMTQVHAEEIVRYGTAGQTTANLGMPPAKSGTVHLWVYPSLLGISSNLGGFVYPSDSYFYREPMRGLGEVASADFAIVSSTGAVTLQGTLAAGLQLGQRLYATYDVDVDAAEFSISSLADIVVIGSAAMLGQRLYTEATQKWDLVTTYQAKYDALIASLRDGTLIPDEMRRINYWTPVERAAQGQWGGVKLGRA